MSQGFPRVSESVRGGYKLYAFLNAFFLTPEDRRRMEDLKRDGKTLLFFYAPGYVSQESGLQTTHISTATGISTVKKSGTELMTYRVTNTEHAITQGLPRDTTCSVQPFGYAISRKLHPAKLGPVFHIDDADATSLGEYPDGKTALAVKRFGDWASAYCTVPRMDSKLLRGVARFAGVHLYSNDDLVLKVDNRLLMLHNGNDARAHLTISLPGSRKVVDAYTSAVVTPNGPRFTVTLPKMATRLYWLDEAME